VGCGGGGADHKCHRKCNVRTVSCRQLDNVIGQYEQFARHFFLFSRGGGGSCPCIKYGYQMRSKYEHRFLIGVRFVLEQL